MSAEPENPSQTEDRIEGNENPNPARVEFESLQHEDPRTGREDLHPVQETRESRTSTNMVPLELAGLHTPHKKRRLILSVGVVLATLDLCCLPITYYYALRFGTSLTIQDVFAVITGVYGLISFTHYSFRSLKLFRSKTSPLWRPVGWTRWGLAEFLHINFLIIMTLVEIELIAGTAPNNPIVRLCAMPSPTICYWLGSLFCFSAMATHLQWKLPFNMSSSPKGTTWKPALLAFIEDTGAIEGQGGVEYRVQVMKRYDASLRFRRLVMYLTWGWGLGLIGIAIVSTVLIMVLNENVGFGIGWGLPWAFAAACIVMTVIFVKRELALERVEWLAKASSSASIQTTL